MHKRNNINKHRSLLPVGFTTGSLSTYGDLAVFAKLSSGPLEQGSEVARFPSDTEGHENVDLTFDVALNELEADTVMWPLIVALRTFYNTVFRTVEKFDAYR
jgi:hypothetical protein